MYLKDKRILIAGIDHGFSSIKSNHFIFDNGVENYGGETTMTTNTMKYEGEYYKVGEGRLPLKNKKTDDSDYLLLTYAAIAKEIEFYELPENAKLDVVIGAGLPFTRFGDEKNDFYNYLKIGSVRFKYEGRNYFVNIREVYLFPQCYAAVANILGKLAPEQLIVDIGSKTIDIIHTQNYVPIERDCVTIPEALIHCMADINNVVYRKKNCTLKEYQIQDVMINGTGSFGDDYLKIVQNELRKFAEGVEAKLRELGFVLELTPVIYVGGGATVMKHFGSIKGRNICYQEDVKANAIGYEYLASKKVEGWANGQERNV